MRLEHGWESMVPYPKELRSGHPRHILKGRVKSLLGGPENEFHQEQERYICRVPVGELMSEYQCLVPRMEEVP